jgi:hypothetical protein
MSENVQTFSGKVNVADNLLVGTSHFFVDRQNNRVGIGTSTPDASSMLDVTGNIKSGGTITATGGFSGNGSGLTGVNSDSGSWVNGSSSNIHLAVSTDNVGIGVLDAGYKLDIQFTGDNGLRVKNTATGTSDHSSIYIDSGSGNSYLKFLHSGTNKFTIQGTTSGDMAFRPNGGDHALDIKSNHQTEISSTRTGLTALTNNEATLMISCTDTNAADDGDIGGGVVFRQRWINSSSSLVPTGGIYVYKGRNSGSYGGGLIFTYCPDNGSPDNLVEAMRITKEGHVGIGTISDPSTKLHIGSGDIGIDRDQKFDFGAGYSANWYIKQKSADNKIYFERTGGSGNELVIDTTGNIGIGMQSPNAKLDVNGTFNAKNHGWRITGSGGNATYSAGDRFFRSNKSPYGSSITTYHGAYSGQWNASLGKFTFPTAGLYHINLHMFVNGTVSGRYSMIEFQRSNGTANYSQYMYFSEYLSDNQKNWSTMYEAGAGDYFYMYPQSGSITLYIAATHTVLDVYKIC